MSAGREGVDTPRTSIELTFGICDVCGKKDGRPGHECDGGEALRKAARELFGPVIHMMEPLLVKAGTGILQGVFEVVFERDALSEQLATLTAELGAMREALLRCYELASDPHSFKYDIQATASNALSELGLHPTQLKIAEIRAALSSSVPK